MNWEETLKNLHYDIRAAETKVRQREKEFDALAISDAEVELIMAKHKFNAAIAHYMQYLGRQWEDR